MRHSNYLYLFALMLAADQIHAGETGPRPRLSAEEIDALLAEGEDDESMDELLFLLDEDPAGLGLGEDPALAEIYRDGVDQAASELAAKELADPGFDYSADLTFSSGYRTNVTLSAFESLDSAFVGGAATVFLSTDPAADWFARAITLYERTSFVELPNIEDEVLAYGSLQGERRWEAEALGLEAEYVYLDQFFDASTSTIITRNERLQLHEFTGAAYWNRDLAADLLLEVTGGAERTEVLDSNDDVTTPYGNVDLIWLFDPETRSTLEGYALAAYEVYDDRVAREGDGAPRAETVRLWEFETGLDLEWNPEALPGATLAGNAEFRAQLDPRGGYYQNFLWRLGGEASYALDPVTLRAYGEIFWRDYPERVTTTSPPLISTRSTTIYAGASVRYPIRDWISCELGYDFDASFSDEPASEFTAHTGSFTLNVSF